MSKPTLMGKRLNFWKARPSCHHSDRDHTVVIIEDILLSYFPEVAHPFGATDAVEVGHQILDAIESPLPHN